MTRITHITQLMALLMMAAALFVGCENTDEYTDGEPCSGETIEVDSDAYCIFIEEGFLTSGCPESFPHGNEIGGVVVCSQEEKISAEDIEKELRANQLAKSDFTCGGVYCHESAYCFNDECVEREGYIGDETGNNDNNHGDAECLADDDCPDVEPSRVCEGDVQVITAGWSSACIENACVAPPVAPPERRDCALDGAICQDGECIHINPGECAEDSDCPSAESLTFCDGNILTTSSGFTSSCMDNVCITPPVAPPVQIDCTESNQVCDAGAGTCADEQVGECTADTDCPSFDGRTTCEGNVLTIEIAFASSCVEGTCIIPPVAPPVSVDCNESNQVCDADAGACVDNQVDECTADTDCPSFEGGATCEDNVLTIEIAFASSCVEGICAIPPATPPVRLDCNENNQVCDADVGACVNPAGACQVNEDCPGYAARTYCNGSDTLVIDHGSHEVCEEGMCIPTPGPAPEVIDCAAMGQVCDNAECVDAP